jgi:hypothetical protein
MLYGVRLVLQLGRRSERRTVAGEGTFLDVQEAAQKAFDSVKDNIDNPVYEIEKAWKSGYVNGWRSAIKTSGMPEQEALDNLHATEQ